MKENEGIDLSVDASEYDEEQSKEMKNRFQQSTRQQGRSEI